MAETIKIAGEIESTATGNKVADIANVKDKTKGNKSQAEINAETETALADRYTKTETYNKSELNNMITTPSQEFETYTATDQDTDISDILPSEGSADTVYRVGNWDGSQFDETVYSEYAWNGSQYVHLSTKTKIGEVFDISAYHATGGALATYADLSDALDSNNGGGIPQSLQEGGMSVKYVQSSDNKYVQYRYMGTETTGNPNPFLNTANWQGVDNKPTYNSLNLINSNAAYNLKQKEETLNANISSIIISEIGTISSNSGVNADGYPARARTICYIESPLDLTVANGYLINSYSKYSQDVNGKITHIGTSSLSNPAHFVESSEGFLYRLTFKKSDDSNFTDTDLTQIVSSFKGKMKIILEKESITIEETKDVVKQTSFTKNGSQKNIISLPKKEDAVELYQKIGKNIDNILITGRAINVGNYSVGDVVNISSVTNAAINCFVIPVYIGNTFILSGAGATNPRLWAILDSDKKLLSMANAQSTVSNYKIEIAQNGYLIINVKNENSYQISYVSKFADANLVNQINTDVTNLKSNKNYELFDSPNHYYIDAATGLMKYNSALSNKCTTKYIPVKEGITIYGCKGGSSARCAFYDEFYNFISTHAAGTNGNNQPLVLTSSIIPANAKFFRATGNTGVATNLPYIAGLTDVSIIDYAENKCDVVRDNSVASFTDKIYKDLGIVNNQEIGSVVDVNALANVIGMACAVIKCNKGDVITISGNGSVTYKLWTFVDKDYKVVNSCQGTHQASNQYKRDFVYIIPEDGYLICNSNPSTFKLVKNSLDKQLSFKKARWMAMGDSIVQGYYSSYNDQQEGVSGNDYNNTWVTKVAAINGWTLNNQGVGGEGWDDPGLEHGARTRVDNMDFSNTDLVTIAYGINDYKGNKALGSMSDDVSTVYSVVTNMRYVIEKIIQSNPLCKIVIITPLNARGYDDELGDESTNYALGHANTRGYTLEDMYQAMVEVCEYYGIQYIDMTHRSIINRKNIMTTLPDGVHPSIAAHLAIGKQLAKEITFY